MKLLNSYSQDMVKRALELNLLGCPCCGKELDNNFKLLKQGNYELPEEEEEKNRNRGYFFIRKTVRIICRNCGYISEFAESELMRKYEDEIKEFERYHPSGKTDIPLDERQKRFVEEFLRCENKFEAAEKSGYSIADAPFRVLRVINAIKEGRQKKLEGEKSKKFHVEP